MHKNITYGIYYGITLDELYDEPKLTTQSLKATLKDLEHCESYLISVGIVGPVGPGPLLSPKIHETKYNEKKPPRNVKATMIVDKRQIEITWESSCALLGQYPSSYMVAVTELTTNITKTAELNRKGTKIFSHTIKNVPDGAVYNISISTNVKNAEPVTLKIHAPQLPPVRQLKVLQQENGTYVVYWHEINDNNGKYEYEMVVVPGKVLNDSISPIVKKKAVKPPALINPPDLGGNTAAGKMFTIGIRLKTADGMYSPFHEIEHIEVQPDAWLSTMLPTKSSAWMVIIPMMFIIAMGGAAFYMVRRHRRLSNTFSRFANSHYDTKTGTTRIGDEDDHHHHDTDNINDLPRFDDDEPLVLT